MTYRRVWRGSVITTFITPVLFLAAMGLGLGTLVDDSAGVAALDAVDYITFLAPGLLAATAMQTGAGDSSFPVMAGIKWVKNYEATLATPVGIRDLTFGHFGWISIRLTFVSLVYVGVSLVFGAIGLAGGLIAVAPAGTAPASAGWNMYRIGFFVYTPTYSACVQSVTGVGPTCTYISICVTLVGLARDVGVISSAYRRMCSPLNAA